MTKTLFHAFALSLGLTFAGYAWAASARTTVFISDLHVGAGRDASGAWIATEDFRWQDDFDAFLDHVGSSSGNDTDLVLVGDVFELWQSPFMQCSADRSAPVCVIPDCHESDTGIGCSEEEAYQRLQHVLKQHADFVAGIRRFAARGDNAVYFIPGNHDAALLFPRVYGLLLEHFQDLRVHVATQGYWLSADSRILADHGHQYDQLNRFAAAWPTPFVERQGVRYISKPWGENMVQQFYNQYEAVFPIIDNLSDEASGVEFAVRSQGFPGTAEAIGRFARFFLFQQSLKQAYTALGKSGNGQPDYVQVRKLPAAFFLDVLQADPVLGPQADAARQQGLVQLEATQLGDAEIDAVCRAKQLLKTSKPCPGSTLGAAADAVMRSDDDRRKAYLRATLDRVAPSNKPAAALYVFGHTHAAAAPMDLELIEMKYGSYNLQYVNDGAFQRIASAEQINELLRQPRHSGKQALDLQPEDLPACYGFVQVEPYDRLPRAQLRTWSRDDEGRYTSAVGSCVPTRPAH